MDNRFIFYDIETLPKDYTVVSYIAKAKQVIIYANTKVELDEQAVCRALNKRFGTTDVDPDSPYYDLVRKVSFAYSPQAYARMRSWLLFGGSQDGLARGGWNSKHFDVPVLMANIHGTAKHAREIADDIITRGIRPYKLDYSDGTRIQRNDMNYALNAEWAVDVATLNEKSGDVDGKTRTPAGLKMVSAYAGLDVLDDALTRVDFDQWSDEYYDSLDTEVQATINRDMSLTSTGLVNLIEYNTLDVINTGLLFDLPEYVDGYETKMGLIERYKLNSPERKLASPSDTSASISSLVLTGGDRNLYSDIEAVNFQFPMPDGSYIDLLDELHEHKVIPEVVYDYYDTMRGRSIQTPDHSAELLKDLDTVLEPDIHVYDGVDVTNLPIKPAKAYDHDSKHTNGTITVPYFDADLNPIPSYDTFSRGGGHGATSTNAINFSFEDARMLKYTLVKDKTTGDYAYLKYDNDIQKKTTDTSAWAIDVGSFYPTFMSKLKTYQLPDGSDPYDDIRTERLKIKQSLPPLKINYTVEDKRKNKMQLDSKLILNSVTGASNKMSKWSLLPLDNAILSMRAMGNLFIYMIATMFVRRLGAHVLSTNTDGIEITFDHLDEQPTKADIEALSAELTEKWGFELEPERLTRFVAKDSNSRIEWHGDVINKVGGKLGKGFNPDYANGKPNRINLDSKLDHPQVTDLAVLAYIDSHKDYLNPANKVVKPTKTRPATQEVVDWLADWIVSYGQEQYYDIKFNPQDWTLFTKNTKSRKFYLDGFTTQDNNRYVYAKADDEQAHLISSELNDKPTKVSGWTSLRVKVLNTWADLRDLTFEEIDVQPYAEWAYNTLITWVNPEQRKVARAKKNLNPKKKAMDDGVNDMLQLDLFDINPAPAQPVIKPADLAKVLPPEPETETEIEPEPEPVTVTTTPTVLSDDNPLKGFL